MTAAFVDEPELEIKVEPHTTSKVVLGKTITKSFGQDFVFMKDDRGRWQHIGYYSYSAKYFSGLIGWDNSLNDAVCKQLSILKKCNVRHSMAPQLDQEVEQDDFDDEDD